MKKHPFFRSIDWDRLYRKELPVPYVGAERGSEWQLPEVRGKQDTSMFSSEFTSQPVSSQPSFTFSATDDPPYVVGEEGRCDAGVVVLWTLSEGLR